MIMQAEYNTPIIHDTEATDRWTEQHLSCYNGTGQGLRYFKQQLKSVRNDVGKDQIMIDN